MNDIIVSVRMPKQLLSTLKYMAEKKQFMDLSEEIRSITRQKWLQFTRPELSELKKLRQDIAKEIKEKTHAKMQHEINKELDKIRKQLKDEELLR